MPSIAAIDKFKTLVYQMGGEPEARQHEGLAPLDIRPPESQVDQGLADLLVDMPVSDESQTPGNVLEDAQPDIMADLFGDSPSSGNTGSSELSLDDLISGMGETTAPDDGMDFLNEMSGGMVDTPEISEEAPDTGSDFNLEGMDFGSLDDPEPEKSVVEEPFAPPSGSGEILEDDFFSNFGGDDTETESLKAEPESFDAEEVEEASEAEDTAEVSENDFTGADIWGDGTDISLDNDYLTGEIDSEMMGLAEATESEVESFDESAEVDEFNLDDFGAEYSGSTDDFVNDEAVLNPSAFFQAPDTVSRPITITDEEFQRLQDNLNLYPLNLKIAVEELLGEKELRTEDANNLVRQILNGVSIKVMAGLAGKLLERKIEIPAGYEKGSGELLQLQQSSIIYHARRVLLPVLLRFAFLTAALGLLVFLLGTFLYRPIRANSLYEEGFAALQKGDETLSEDFFLKALGMNDYPPWYLIYAQEYTRQGDLDAARIKFLQLLRPAYGLGNSQLSLLPQRPEIVIQDLQRMGYTGADILSAGFPEKAEITEVKRVFFLRPYREAFIQWAQMEAFSGFDGTSSDKHYLVAENLLRRALDLIQNDKQSLLFMGDIYRAWAASLLDERRPGLIRFTNRDYSTLRRSANRVYTEYMTVYENDNAVKFRWIEYFIEEPPQAGSYSQALTEMRRLQQGMNEKPELRPGGLLLAKWAGWFMDRENERLAQLALPVNQEARIRNSLTQGRTGSQALLEETLPLRDATGMEDFQIFFYYPVSYQNALGDQEFWPQVYVSYNSASGQLREPFGPRENPARMQIIPGGGGWYTADLVQAGIAPGQEILVTFLKDGRTLTGNREFSRDRSGWLVMEDGFPMWYPSEPFIKGQGFLVSRTPIVDEVTQEDIQTFRDWLLEAQAGTDGSVPEIHFELGRFFRLSGQLVEEQKALSATDYYFRVLEPVQQRKSERVATRIETLVRIGEIQRQSGATTQAEKTFQEARGLFESSQELGLWFGEKDQARLFGYLGDLFFLDSGEWNVALSFYDKALGFGALSIEQRYRRAVSLYQQNRFSDALDEFFRLERTNSLRGNQNLRYSLASTLYRLGNYGTANEFFLELYDELRSVVSRITNWQPAERDADRVLAVSYYKVMNNLAAAQFYALAGKDRDHPAFGEILNLIVEAKAVEDALGRRFGSNPEELVRLPEDGLVGLNMKELLSGDLDPLIFPSLPLSLDSESF